MSKEEKHVSGLYYSVIEGTFRTKVEKEHPEAIAREYETKDGVKSTKYERKASALVGYIQDIRINDGDYGKTINITLDENDEKRSPIIQLSVATNYGEDFLKKLPSIDLNREVRLRPYAFTDDKGKDVRGIEITQKSEKGDTLKIKNFFYDPEKNIALNGYPIPTGEVGEYSKEDWKIFYLQARKFLIQYTLENVIPKLGNRGERIKDSYPVEEINPDDIPF